MGVTLTRRSLLRRHIALPGEHGAWVFLLSPLLIGLFAGLEDASRRPGAAQPGGALAIALLVAAALSAFLLRQPVSIAVKALAGRRSRADVPAAAIWAGLYGLITLAAVAGLVALGFGSLLALGVPAVLVFGWHLVLISRRAERRQLGVEIVGSGALALAAPAAYWVALGAADVQGWWLWLLTWLQSAASIVYAYLRLAQRELPGWPPVAERLRLGRRALLYAAFNVLFALGLAVARQAPPLVPLPYLLQLAETVFGTLRPAVKLRPTRIGVRQLIVSSLFTLVFILAWGGRG